MDTITSRKNEKVTYLKKLGSSRSFRCQEGRFLCDGWKLLEDAVISGAVIEDIFFASGTLPVGISPDVRIYAATREVIEAISPLTNPQDVVFSCRMRDIETGVPAGSIIIENMQDPGNVGTVLRTANAFDIPAVVTVGDCADPYGPKAVRASMGAIFRQRICAAGIEDIENARCNGMKVYGAALGDNCADIRTVSLKNCAVAIGNEGGGLTEALLEACDGRIIIPMSPRSESLNAAAAAAVVMWEMVRCR